MENKNKLLIRSLKVIMYIVLMVSLPALITASVEWIQIRDIEQTKEWMLAHPYQLFLGYIFVFVFFIILYIASARLWLAMLGTSMVFVGAALVNYYKLILRGDPFMPWDLMLQKEAGNIFAHLNISIDETTWLLLGILIFISLALLLVRPYQLKWPYRVGGLILFIGLGTILMKNTYLDSERLEKAGIEDIFWNQTRNYEINGFLTGFGINIKNAMIKAPAAYSKQTVNQIIDEYMEAVPVFSQDQVQKRPNIIIIMNEAFWDPTLLQDINYSRDPIPTLNKIRQEGTSGWLLAPGYGGGTANTEFEVLTGHSMSFFPTGAMAYQQYIKGPLDSMASYLRNKGYATIAIHPYVKWFWDRENVYPYLGFEEFISDEDFIAPHKRGAFISDMESSHEIIRQYEKHKDRPFFNYTVTMQNHGPYNDKRYGDDTIKARGGNLSEESRDILETFTEGVRDADDALGYLMDYFESIDDPTMIVMFGDHLPMLGNDYSVYREAGFISQEGLSLDDEKNLHLTPLIIWNNYANKKEDIGIINASYLAAYLMDYAKMQMPSYYKFLNHMHQELPPYITEVVIDQEGSTSERLEAKQEKIRQKHWILQYDLMFGEEYGKDIIYTD